MSIPTATNSISGPIEMRESMAETHREALQSRPENTTKSYARKQDEYRKWCDKKLPNSPVETRYIVYGEKLYLFLKEEVMSRDSRRKVKGASVTKKIKRSTFMLYVAAIIDLYQQQVRARANTHPHPRSAVKELIALVQNQEEDSRRDNYDRRGLQRSISEESTPQDLLLQRAMPFLEQRLTTMSNDIATRFSAMQADMSSVLKSVSDLATGRTTVNLSINWPQDSEAQQTPTVPQPTPMTVTSIPRPLSPEHQPMDIDPMEPPVYKMNRGVKNVTDLWTEWSEGFSGGYAVRELERRWGTKWRNDDRKWFSRRHKIIKAIERYARAQGITEETAAAIVESRRVSLGLSLGKLNDQVDQLF